MFEIRDSEMLKDLDIIYANKIVLYGAGDYGNRALKLLRQIGISIYGICDSNRDLWGESLNEHKILSIQDLKEVCEDENIIIIVTIASQENIKQVLKLLKAHGILEVSCYTYFALKYAIELNIDDKRIPSTFRNSFKVAKNAYRQWQFMDDERKGLSIIWNIVLQDVILDLQPAKVGSTSVFESLLKSQVNCIHSHILASDWVVKEISAERAAGISILRDIEKIRIISMVRDPISRDISAYFSCFQEYILYDIVQSDTYKGINDYLDRHTKVGDYGAIFEWFNMEIKKIFGIDVLEYDFNKEKGYQIIQKDNVELLLVKAEQLDFCQDIIGKFVEVEDFKVERKNVGSEKLCKFVYDEVKKRIEIPKYILDFYYKENKAMDHFYTAEEKEKLRKKWSRMRYPNCVK